jgi:hypothetical protein
MDPEYTDELTRGTTSPHYLALPTVGRRYVRNDRRDLHTGLAGPAPQGQHSVRRNPNRGVAEMGTASLR